MGQHLTRQTAAAHQQQAAALHTYRTPDTNPVRAWLCMLLLTSSSPQSLQTEEAVAAASAAAWLVAPTALAPCFLIEQAVVGSRRLHKHPMHKHHAHYAQEHCQRQYYEQGVAAASQRVAAAGSCARRPWLPADAVSACARWSWLPADAVSSR